MSEPTTEAGKRLVIMFSDGNEGPLEDAIAAIEQEARAAVLREVRAEVAVERKRYVDAASGAEALKDYDGEDKWRDIIGGIDITVAAIDRRLEADALGKPEVITTSTRHTREEWEALAKAKDDPDAPTDPYLWESGT
jgi:hypothetical protein